VLCLVLLLRPSVWDMTRLYVRHDSFVCETWLLCMWDMTHLYVRHDSCVCVLCLVPLLQPSVWDMTHLYVRHDSFVYESWLICMWDMTHLYPGSSGKGLQHLLGATKRAFFVFYIFWNSDYRQRFPQKWTWIWRYRKRRFCVFKVPLSPLHSTRGVRHD